MAYGSGPYRIKTNEQKAREQEALQAIEGDNAKARQGTRTDLQDNIKENFPESETGQARDIAARAVGWSGRTDDTRAMDLYDQALQRKPGGANNPLGIGGRGHKKPPNEPFVNHDNVMIDKALPVKQ